MKLRRPLLVSAALLAALAGSAPRAGDAPTARRIAASIAVDGRVVLRAGTSDDGHPDADAVWGYLVDRLDFRPTPAFAALGVDEGAETVTIGWLKSRASEDRGEPPTIALEVDYGGRDAPFRLGLVRAPGGGAWRVDRDTVERRFAHRWITRAQAARLDDPERAR